MNYPYYLSTKGIFYPAELKTISKHPDGLQSLYEVFTNSWEAIIDKYGNDNLSLGKIQVEFYVTEQNNLSNEKEREFVKIGTGGGQVPVSRNN